MWPVRVLHVSDLHAGTAEEPPIENALRALVADFDPELVVASGDLTHRNQPEQHARAAALLRSLERPLLVVPGNHDIPMLPPGRFTSTFAAFGRERPETEPVYRSERIVACGLNSVRPWRRQAGAVSRKQVAHTAEVFADAPPLALRIVALHHQLVSAPWRTAKRPVAHRSRVLGGLVDGGAELVLSGHVHQSSVAERREFEVVQEAVRGSTIATAPGFGHPRPKRRGEARGLHAIEADETTLRLLTYAWSGDAWLTIADRRFPRGRAPLGR